MVVVVAKNWRGGLTPANGASVRVLAIVPVVAAQPDGHAVVVVLGVATLTLTAVTWHVRSGWAFEGRHAERTCAMRGGGEALVMLIILACAGHKKVRSHAPQPTEGTNLFRDASSDSPNVHLFLKAPTSIGYPHCGLLFGFSQEDSSPESSQLFPFVIVCFRAKRNPAQLGDVAAAESSAVGLGR